MCLDYGESDMRRISWSFVAALSMAFFMATCSGGGGGGGGGGTPPAPVLPTVKSTSPAAGATNVAINTVIAAAFSGEMDAATINGTTFTLSNGVNGVVTYDSTNFIATFAPAGNLASNTTYTATITTGVRDKAGNAMASNFEWNFTTGSTLDTSLPQVLSTTPSAGASSVPVNTADDGFVLRGDGCHDHKQRNLYAEQRRDRRGHLRCAKPYSQIHSVRQSCFQYYVYGDDHDRSPGPGRERPGE